MQNLVKKILSKKKVAPKLDKEEYQNIDSTVEEYKCKPFINFFDFDYSPDLRFKVTFENVAGFSAEHLTNLTFPSFEHCLNSLKNTKYESLMYSSCFGFVAPTRIKTVKIAGVLVPDILNSPIVSVTDFVTFDGICSRLSFKDITQIRPGTENGVLISFQAIQKNTSELQNVFSLKSYPRTEDPVNRPLFQNYSSINFGTTLKNDIFAIIHDRKTEVVSSDQEESVKFYTQENKRVKINLRLKATELTRSLENPEVSCRPGNKSLYDCMVAKMPCNPLEQNCPELDSAAAAIDMTNDDCRISRCYTEKLIAENVFQNSIKSFIESQEISSFGDNDEHFALSNPNLKHVDNVIYQLKEMCGDGAHGKYMEFLEEHLNP